MQKARKFIQQPVGPIGKADAKTAATRTAPISSRTAP